MPSPRLLHDTWGRTAPLLKGHGVVLQRPQPREGPPQGTQRRRGALLRGNGRHEAPGRQPPGRKRPRSGQCVNPASQSGRPRAPPAHPASAGGCSMPRPPSAPHPPLPAALLSRVRCGAGRQRALVAGGSEGPGWKALEV